MTSVKTPFQVIWSSSRFLLRARARSARASPLCCPLSPPSRTPRGSPLRRRLASANGQKGQHGGRPWPPACLWAAGPFWRLASTSSVFLASTTSGRVVRTAVRPIGMNVGPTCGQIKAAGGVANYDLEERWRPLSDGGGDAALPPADRRNCVVARLRHRASLLLPSAGWGRGAGRAGLAGAGRRLAGTRSLSGRASLPPRTGPARSGPRVSWTTRRAIAQRCNERKRRRLAAS